MTDTFAPARARKAGRSTASSPRGLLAVVLTGQFMALLDASAVNVAAPAIRADLRSSGAGLQLVIAGYVITYAVLLVTGARLGDTLGHRRVFLAGLAVFTAASLGCGLAGSTAALVALRFVQGAGAAAMIPQVLSLIQRTFPGPARARPMRLYAAVLAGGTMVGQVAGGLLVSADLMPGAWRPVFLLNVPIGVILFAAGARRLPPGRGEPGRKLDLAGLATLTPGVLALVAPLVLGQSEHWPPWVWICLSGAAVLLVAFAVVERRAAQSGRAPLAPAEVLRLPGVSLGVVALFAVMAVYGGFFFVLGLHLQSGLGDSSLRAGLSFSPAAAAFAAVSLNWQRVPERARSTLMLAGLGAEAAGLAALALVLRGGGHGGLALYPVLAVIGAGMAGALSPLMTAVLMRVPVAAAADATGMVVTANQLGLVVGVATFGTAYLNLAGALPTAGGSAFRLMSAHAIAVTCLVLAVATAGAGVLVAVRAVRLRD